MMTWFSDGSLRFANHIGDNFCPGALLAHENVPGLLSLRDRRERDIEAIL
jgi:hypothetical protein